MELNVVFLCATVGALVGTTVGVLLMYRKIRLPITETELVDLKNKLQAAESSVGAHTATVEELRKQIAERDQTIQTHSGELKKKHEQLELVIRETEKEMAKRSVAEQRAHEMSTHSAALAEQRAGLESQLQEERNRAAEKTAQIASLEAERAEDARRIQELTDRLDALNAEIAALKTLTEQESQSRTSLEAQLKLERERTQELSSQVTELEKERFRFDSQLQQERQSAAKGMELLLMAQENFSRVFQPANGHSPAAKNGHESAAASNGAGMSSEDLDRLQSAVSSD